MDVIEVVGIGADGIAGVPPRLRAIIDAAEVLLGGERHLDLVGPIGGQERLAWPRPLRENLPALLEACTGRRVVALASGDPFVSGIGTTLVELLGAERVRVHPAVSSVALARGVLGWPAETSTVLSLVGRDVALLARELAPGHRVLVLSSDEHTPAKVAELLTAHGYGASMLHVLGDLGSAAESRRTTTAQAWTGTAPRLHVLGLDLVGPPLAPWSTGLPDTAFEHDGQLSKRDVRASALARLAPSPGALLWDVGAGAGSVGIEWMRTHPTCGAIAIEGHSERAARIARNARALGVPGLRIVEGRAPDALAGLPAPDAIFVGGGATVPGVLEACRAALRPGGRLVVHGVTIETEQVVAALHAEHGGELTRLSVETAAPIGTFTGWTPARAVTQWAWSRPL